MMGPYRAPGTVPADMPKKKLEKLTFTPSRVIEIERTGVQPGRELTFTPFRDFIDDDDWYNRKLNAGPCDTRHPPEEHEMDPRGEYCVRCMRSRSYVESTKPEAVRARKAQAELMSKPMVYVQRSRWTRPAACPGWDTDAPGAIVQADPEKRPQARTERSMVPYLAQLKAELDKRAAVPVDKAPTGAPDPRVTAAAEYLRTRYRREMVATIIASQVAAGGVDTEGTRAQAERWCAWLCECVCEGMRATTEQSALGLFKDDGVGRYDGKRAFLNMAGGKPHYIEVSRGKPLGRP